MMNGNKKTSYKGKLYWTVVVLCAAAIFYFSAQPAAVSNSLSKGIVKYIVDTAVMLLDIDMTTAEQWWLINKINSVGREYMHGIVFFLLGITLHNAVMSSGYRGRRAIVISVAVCLLYGLFDEIHQLFVPGRAFQIRDLLTDAVGSIVAIMLVNFYYNRKMKIDSRKLQ